MATKKVERMKEGFLERRRQCNSMEEIATAFGVSHKYIYQCLQDIADKEGVSRESLLFRPQQNKDNSGGKNEEIFIDVQELKQKIIFAKNKLTEIREKCATEVKMHE